MTHAQLDAIFDSLSESHKKLLEEAATLPDHFFPALCAAGEILCALLAAILAAKKVTVE